MRAPRIISARIVLLLTLGLLTWAPASPASASSPEELPLSNEAAIMGGAVMASGLSAGSFWYNPALLGRIRHSETEASAEVYGARLTRAARGAELTLPDGSSTVHALRSDEIVTVPTTFAGAFALTPSLTLGFGLFTPASSDFTVKADAQRGDEAGGDTTFQLRHRRASQRLYGGLGLGWNASDRFQLGASIFALYDQSRSEQRLFVARSQGAAERSALFDEDTTVGTIALATTLGVRGRLHPLVHAAATVRTPNFVLEQSISGTRLVSLVGSEDAGTELSEIDPAPWSQSQLSGWRFAAGLAVGDREGQLTIDVDATTGTGANNRGGPLSTRPAFGARLGGLARVAETVSVGAGAFLQSNEGAGDSFGITQMNRWGGSLGLELRRRLELKNRESIEFRTVVAGWYAYGRGTIGGLLVSSEGDSLGQSATFQTPAQTHLIVLHIGSALAF